MSKAEPIIIDMRGTLCPKPVIETKKVTDAYPAESVTTIVDNEVSRDNVEKFGKSRGYTVFITQDGKDFYLTLTPSEAAKNQGESVVGIANGASQTTVPNDITPTEHFGNRVLLMTKDYLGEGSEELGRNLMKTFWTCVLEADVKPSKIYCINSAVKMVTNDSVHLDNLKALATAGVEIAACGICLDFYGLKESVGVGTITNLYAITDSIMTEAVVKM